MVRLTRNYLIRHADNLKLLQFRNKSDTDDGFLARIIHLKLNDKYFDKVEPIDGCKNVTAIYFQNNLLGSIENLNYFPKLTHLYLQRNKISKIENLESLVNLRKIYLGYNEISVLEGFELLPSIKEIHIEFQRLPLGESLHFDPRTIANLSKCLQVLNVAGNGLTTLFSLFNMDRLRELIADENEVTDLGQLLIVLTSLPQLERLNITKNPVSSLREFKDAVIFSAKKLSNLDDKEVKRGTREFIEGRMRARQSREKFQNSRGSGDEKEFPQTAMRKIVHFTDFLERPVADKELENEPLLYPPWQLRPNLNVSEGKYVPRSHRSRNRMTEDEGAICSDV